MLLFARLILASLLPAFAFSCSSSSFYKSLAIVFHFFFNLLWACLATLLAVICMVSTSFCVSSCCVFVLSTKNGINVNKNAVSHVYFMPSVCLADAHFQILWNCLRAEGSSLDCFCPSAGCLMLLRCIQLCLASAPNLLPPTCFCPSIWSLPLLCLILVCLACALYVLLVWEGYGGSASVYFLIPCPCTYSNRRITCSYCDNFAISCLHLFSRVLNMLSKTVVVETRTRCNN